MKPPEDKTSVQITRAQLVGMIAELRACVFELKGMDPDDVDEDAVARLMKATAFDLDPADAGSDGGFDRTWEAWGET
jgi:hypothetical protein